MKQHVRLVVKVILVMLMVLAMITMCLVGEAQDTTVYRRVNYPLFSGAKYDTTFVFLLPKPKPIVIIKKDTVVVRDTIIIKETVIIRDSVFVNNCDTPKPKNKITWSTFGGTFQQFIDSAIISGKIAVVDKDVQPMAKVIVKGNLRLNAMGNTITNTLPVLFNLWDGVHEFDSLNIVQSNLQGVAFYTEPKTGSKWKNTLRNVNITGGKNGYESSRGGDSANWCTTIIENATIKILGGICISIFSQDGPYKSLHLKNVRLSSDTTHNIYVHPSVSLWFDSVYSVKSGKLFMHQYSGSGNGGYGTAKYSYFKKVVGKYGFEMTRIKDGYITIDSSEIAPYVTAGVPTAKVWATNSMFFNAGNGILLSGTLFNCKGGAWSSINDTLNIVNSDMKEVSMRVGGYVFSDNSTVDYMTVADRGYDFHALFSNSVIKSLSDGRNGNGVIYLNNTPIPPASFGQAYRPEIIKQLNRNE